MQKTAYLACIAVAVAAIGASSAHAAPSWWRATYPLPDGEQISINISTRYPQVEAVAERWAGFFAGLPHGKEISLVQVYIAPLDEVAAMCFSVEVLGCYRGQMLVAVGSAVGGLLPTSIAAHEYGHHVAANRANAPWPALDWGPKRWASAAGICNRVAAGMAFPGDEGLNYALNPGEAFAESYRVLVETNGTALGFSWPIVDPSFRPDAATLAAVRADVVEPWVGPTTTTMHGTFGRRARTWSTSIATPLDGDIRVRVDVPGGGTDDVMILSADGRRVLARGAWDSAGGKAVQFRICGTRALKVRLARGGQARRFTLRVTKP